MLCRVCGRTLSEAGEIKLMRCEDCPSDLDEALYERLRGLADGAGQGAGQPAYCVFTDKTLLAIAEVRPSDEQGLSAIAGVGARKLDKFGDGRAGAVHRGWNPTTRRSRREYGARCGRPDAAGWRTSGRGRRRSAEKLLREEAEK